MLHFISIGKTYEPFEMPPKWTICTIITWVRDRASGHGRSVTCIWFQCFRGAESCFSCLRFGMFWVQFICRWLIMSARTGCPSPTQAITVQMVYSKFDPFEMSLKFKIWPLWDATENPDLTLHLFPLFWALTSAIAIIRIQVARSLHGGACPSNCLAKACHMAKLKRFDWGQVCVELSWTKAGRSWSLEKLWSPFFFESIAELFDNISFAQSKSLRVIIATEQLTWRQHRRRHGRSIEMLMRRLTSIDRHVLVGFHKQA